MATALKVVSLKTNKLPPLVWGAYSNCNLGHESNDGLASLTVSAWEGIPQGASLPPPPPKKKLQISVISDQKFFNFCPLRDTP